MSQHETIRAQLPNTLLGTDLPDLGARSEGKVRDIYTQSDRLTLIATDRVSAFDRVLSTVPFKGEVLTRLAVEWFEKTEDILPNHVLDVPDPNVMVVRRCTPIPVELVVRGYITGSLWRDYQAGRAGAYGLDLPEGLEQDQPLPEPILTPTTKAAQGEHDAPITRAEILRQGLASESLWRRCEEAAFALYARGVSVAAERGLILVDTKYEMGLVGDTLVLMDEVHTPDSSRYWIADTYAQRRREGRAPQMLDKENIRQWLIQERGYRGEGPPPPIPDGVRVALAETYLNAYRTLMGRPMPLTVGPVEARIRRHLGVAAPA